MSVDEYLAAAGILLGLVMVAAVVAAYQNRQRNVTRRSWSRVAQRHDLSVDQTPGVVRVFGQIDGLDVEVQLIPDTHNKTQTRISVAVDGLPPGFLLKRSGGGSSAPLAPGNTAVLVGDQAFDRLFHVRCRNEEIALELLTTDVRRALLAVSPAIDVCIIGDQVQWTYYGRLDDGFRLSQALGELSNVSSAIRIAQAHRVLAQSAE